ncbi:class I SAM-dependent methyltransferase [Phenylobacterium sp.]|uniref:class I SAM-dependent methyltransferase n=1 Tax=Phenylobacterium sp. TaxID=1871053 RepID=UPI002ED9A3C4
MRRPRFIAEQARHARGPLGWLIAFIMARETWAQNRRAIDALEVAPDDHVLDVGCGPGRALSELAARAARGRVIGADSSGLMVEVAVGRNRELVRAGRVDVAEAGVEALPFPNDAFDKVLCVHVLYFWPDLDAAFSEIARVMKPGGRLALLFRTDADHEAVHSFPPEVYKFPALSEVTAALHRARMQTTSTQLMGGAMLLLAGAPSDPPLS